MDKKNANTLETLSTFSNIGGLFTIFIGLVVIFIDIMNGDIKHILVGIYIFFAGYAFVKISTKLSEILISERA